MTLVHGWASMAATTLIYLRLRKSRNCSLWSYALPSVGNDCATSLLRYFRTGGRAGPGGSVNAKYGIDPGAVLYTHVSGYYGPFYTRVISATMSEAP
jgi:hypothetical protein